MRIVTEKQTIINTMRAFLILITISVSTPAVVKWTPNKSFNLPMNFRDHKLPCSKQMVVLPETVFESVRIESNIDIKGFVLPKDGEILIEDATISFGGDDSGNCTEEGNAYYTPRSTFSWAQPDVWSSPKFNEATPDAERVPCYDDEVVFPSDSQFTIFLPKVTQHIRKLKINEHYYGTVIFNYLVNFGATDSSQTFVQNENYGLGVIVEDKGCTNSTGCPCQKNTLEIECGQKFCHEPKCMNPVQPIGHCCKICGGFLTLDVGPMFDMLAFEENVADVINSYGKEELVYHIGILSNNKIQLVVVDKGEYVGMSAEAVHAIEYKINNRGLQSFAHISGGPSSKSGFGGKIVLSMFFVVVITMAAIYAYYYKLPELSIPAMPSLNRNQGTRGILSRFQRRTDSVVSLTSRRDSTATLRSVGGSGFRNPLYDSRRGRVHVAEPVAEQQIDDDKLIDAE